MRQKKVLDKSKLLRLRHGLQMIHSVKKRPATKGQLADSDN
jgi:hypothetical protein